VSIAHEFAQAAAASYNVKKAGGRSLLLTATDMTKSCIYDTNIPYLLLSGRNCTLIIKFTVNSTCPFVDIEHEIIIEDIFGARAGMLICAACSAALES